MELTVTGASKRRPENSEDDEANCARARGDVACFTSGSSCLPSLHVSKCFIEMIELKGSHVE